MADSSETVWEPRLGEQFIFSGKRYDLAKAKDMIKATPRPVKRRPPSHLKAMYYEAVKIDWDKAKKTDPNTPVIVAPQEAPPTPIDGWPRYAKALRTRLTEL